MENCHIWQVGTHSFRDEKNCRVFLGTPGSSDIRKAGTNWRLKDQGCLRTFPRTPVSSRVDGLADKVQCIWKVSQGNSLKKEYSNVFLSGVGDRSFLAQSNKGFLCSAHHVLHS